MSQGIYAWPKRLNTSSSRPSTELPVPSRSLLVQSLTAEPKLPVSFRALLLSRLQYLTLLYPLSDRRLVLPRRPRHHPDRRCAVQRFSTTSPPGVSLPLSDGHPPLGAHGRHRTQAVHRTLPFRFGSQHYAIPDSQLYLERVFLQWQSLRRSGQRLGRRPQGYRILALCTVSEESAIHLPEPVSLAYLGRFLSGLSANFSVWSNGSCNVPLQNVIDKGQSYSKPTPLDSCADIDPYA